jgi:hypothetical protein
LYDTGIYGSVIKTFTFDRFTSTSIGCCDIVSDKSTTELLVATNASIFGGLTVGNTFSARDTLIDGGLKVDGKIEATQIVSDSLTVDNLEADTSTLGAVTADSMNVLGNIDAVSISASITVTAAMNVGTLTATQINSGNIGTGDISCQNLTVNGSQTVLNVSTVDIEDPLLKLSNGNTGNLTNMGIYGTYNDGVQRYAGLVRKSSDGVFFLVDHSLEPTPTGILSTANLASIRVNELLTNSIVPNDVLSELVINTGGNFLGFTPGGVTRLNTTTWRVNSVNQDVEKSAYGQYVKTYAVNDAERVEIDNLGVSPGVWASVFTNVAFDTNNVTFTSLTNTFTIQVAGVYRFSYHIALQNLDDDADTIQVSLRRNGVSNDAFESSSKTMHSKMKTRTNTLSSSFIAAVAVGDDIRLYLRAIRNGDVVDEKIDVYSVNVNLERLRQNV